MNALIFVLAMAQATPAAQATPPTPVPSVSPASTACPQASVTLPVELDRVLRDYEAAWAKKDAKTLASIFSEDGFVMAMGGTPVRGRADIERHYASSGGFPLALRAIAYANEGSTGFILGCYAGRPGEPDMGKFTLTLKKTGGRWLIFSDMDNPNRRR
jgi:ketosteroid isomerase-like protein